MNSVKITSNHNQIRLLYIKNLLVFQSPSIYKFIEKYIENSRRKGVEIGELVINSYIYNSRCLEIQFLINYIHCIDNLVGVFRNIYDEYLYDLKIMGYNNVYDNLYDFHTIFNAINNTFNSCLEDQYLFEDFGIYKSETSLITIMGLYETFNNYFVFTLKNRIDPLVLKRLVQYKSMKYLPYIYDDIFEQFEEIYLPFY